MMTTNSVLVMLKTGHGRDHRKYPGAVAFQKKKRKKKTDMWSCVSFWNVRHLGLVQ